ncbi:MAG: hypothetical protein IT165_19160 [Bryobacterales bacterium]|nr:hypothetical protein [Bryobacterales bacterium]
MALADSRGIDGFPLRPEAADYAIQVRIDETLRGCYELRDTYATVGQLYSGYFEARDQEAWLEPGLIRLEWNLGQGHANLRWMEYLGPLLRFALEQAKTISDEGLYRLLDLSTVLYRLKCGAISGRVCGFVGQRHPIAPNLAAALRRFLDFLEARYQDQDTMQLAWLLFLHGPEESQPCWSAGIAGDLRRMEGTSRKAWDALLALISHQSFSEKLDTRWCGKARKAVERIGKAEFEFRLSAWFDAFRGAAPVTLGPAGQTLLRHLLRVCACVPELAVDEALYWLAGTLWTPGRDGIYETPWLKAYLNLLSTRPEEKAFACVERLAQNPALMGLGEVRELYQHHMSRMLVEVRPPAVGADGFPLEKHPRFRRQQEWIDELLRCGTSTDVRQPLKTSILARGAAEPQNLVRAIVERMNWLRQVWKHLPDDQVVFWRCDLGELLREALSRGAKVTLDDLIDLCGLEEMSPAEHVLRLSEAEVEKNGYSVELVKALERFQKSLYGSISALDYRQKTGWLLWFEDALPVDGKECWSSQVRADMRRMDQAEKAAWVSLLRNVSFAQTEKPPAKWKKQAKPLFDRVGEYRFRMRMRQWFSPFSEGEPWRLTIAGRDVLRNLMWYGLPAEDPLVDEAMHWFGWARWKNKEAKDRVAKLLPSFAYVMKMRSPEFALAALDQMAGSGTILSGKTRTVYEELCAAAGRSPKGKLPAPEGGEKGLERHAVALLALDSALRSFEWGWRCRVEGNVLHVRGDLDEYRMEMETGRIVRASDGKVVRVELDLTKPPYQFFKTQIDGKDLNPGPLAGLNLIRVTMCAQVLARDAEEQSRIVVDETE